MKNTDRVIWGIILVAIGVIFALNAFGITNINVFFNGWWTLFIIIPCFAGLFTERQKTGNLIGLLIGVFLLLCCRGILDFGLLWKLVIPVIIVIIGLKMIFGVSFGNKSRPNLKRFRDRRQRTQKTVMRLFREKRYALTERFLTERSLRQSSAE